MALGLTTFWSKPVETNRGPCADFSFTHDDRLLTEDEDDDADAAGTYDSDTDAAAYGGDEL